MHEAFELIMDKLEEVNIIRPNSRCDETVTAAIKAAAKEYNNGWIPVKELKPCAADTEPKEVTVLGEDGSIYTLRAWHGAIYGEWLTEDTDSRIAGEVIAWKQPTPPYIPEREVDIRVRDMKIPDCPNCGAPPTIEEWEPGLWECACKKCEIYTFGMRSVSARRAWREIVGLMLKNKRKREGNIAD